MPQNPKEAKTQFISIEAIETVILNAYKEARKAHPKGDINNSSILKRMKYPLMALVNRKIEKTINPQWQSGEIITQGHKTFNPEHFKIVARDPIEHPE